jgi:hypothetical protein
VDTEVALSADTRIIPTIGAVTVDSTARTA